MFGSLSKIEKNKSLKEQKTVSSERVNKKPKPAVVRLEKDDNNQGESSDSIRHERMPLQQNIFDDEDVLYEHYASLGIEFSQSEKELRNVLYNNRHNKPADWVHYRRQYKLDVQGYPIEVDYDALAEQGIVYDEYFDLIENKMTPTQRQQYFHYQNLADAGDEQAVELLAYIEQEMGMTNIIERIKVR